METTVFMPSSEYPILSMSVPLYYSLFESLEETRQNDDTPEWLKQGCEAASNKLLEYCQKTSVLHISSVVLDPRLKIRYFEGLGWSSNFINQIKDIIKDKYEDEYAPPPPNQEAASTIAEPSQSIISRIYKRMRTELQSEFDIYLMTPIVDQYTDILE
ncbi:hypothetical protein C2G38_1367259 [Gigaspora rosea]|uniref:hAT-like transposase RNase-H fold domain-containing protein n=1 Tax=Gigaspora rosea TaxID=44941 RepID=A0A397VFT7_9GLOM|nr:hypothetical protein C2G38_1367259 [Gigaspora rosea]